MDSTVLSMLTTTPFLSPRDGWLPMPIMSIRPSSFTSPTMAHILVVPISRPTTMLSCLPKDFSLLYHHLARETKVYVRGRYAPLPHVIRHFREPPHLVIVSVASHPDERALDADARAAVVAQNELRAGQAFG